MNYIQILLESINIKQGHAADLYNVIHVKFIINSPGPLLAHGLAPDRDRHQNRNSDPGSGSAIKALSIRNYWVSTKIICFFVPYSECLELATALTQPIRTHWRGTGHGHRLNCSSGEISLPNPAADPDCIRILLSKWTKSHQKGTKMKKFFLNCFWRAKDKTLGLTSFLFLE